MPCSNGFNLCRYITARALVKRWKSLVKNSAAAAAAGNKRRKLAGDNDGGDDPTQTPTNPAPAPVVPWTVWSKSGRGGGRVVDEVRTKAAKMLRDAIDNHWRVSPADLEGNADVTAAARLIESALCEDVAARSVVPSSSVRSMQVEKSVVDP